MPSPLVSAAAVVALVSLLALGAVPAGAAGPGAAGTPAARTTSDRLAPYRPAAPAGTSAGTTAGTPGYLALLSPGLRRAQEDVESSPVEPPIEAPVVVRLFDPPAQRWTAGHRGVDLLAATGTVVLAPADGTVVFAGHVVDRPVLTIAHADGRHRTSLEPVQSDLAVGASVARGQAAGVVASGRSHCAPSCLHWGVRRGQAYIDPLSLLVGAGPTVLLPIP